MEKFNLIALITFHENIDCLDDQISNILKCNDNSCIIINSGYENDTKQFEEKWKNFNVHLFKRTTRHEYHDPLIPLHLECFNYIKEKELSSEYVIMLSSNQLFIRSNILELMRKYSASYFYRYITEANLSWIKNVKNLTRMQNLIGKENFMFQSNHDGMFFKYEIFYAMMNFFNEFYDVNDETSKLSHLEEYLYSAFLLKTLKIADLCPFSKYNYWPKEFHQSIGILELKEALNKNFYIVKKVERIYNDPVRTFIRNIAPSEKNS